MSALTKAAVQGAARGPVIGAVQLVGGPYVPEPGR